MNSIKLGKQYAVLMNATVITDSVLHRSIINEVKD